MTTFIVATRNAHKVQEIRAVLSSRFGYLTLEDLPGAPRVAEDASTFAGNAIKKAVELAGWIARSTHILTSALPKPCDAEGQALQHASATGTGQAPQSAPVTQDGLFCLADDSGLEVDALQGAPGVHSARFAALDTSASGNSSDAANNAKLLRLLAGVPAEARTARFRCAIAVTPVLLERVESFSPVCYADELELSTELFEGSCEGRIIEVPRGAHGFGYDPLFVPTGYEQSFAELGEEVKNRISHRSKALQKLRRWIQGRGSLAE